MTQETIRGLRVLNTEVDEAVGRGLKRSGISPSCSSGCAWCCYKLTLINYAEGMLLADAIVRSGDAVGWMERIKLATRTYSDKVNDGEHWDKRVPCELLTPENECSFYDERPSCCRYMLAVTPAEMCDPDYKEDNVAFIDSLPIQARSFDYSKGREKADRAPPTWIAPLPFVVVHCLKMLDSTLDTGDVTEPWEWWKTHLDHETMFKEHDEIRSKGRRA
jgi:Fe-S-cluster containining protein